MLSPPDQTLSEEVLPHSSTTTAGQFMNSPSPCQSGDWLTAAITVLVGMLSFGPGIVSGRRTPSSFCSLRRAGCVCTAVMNPWRPFQWATVRFRSER